MADIVIPSAAVLWQQPMDPADRVDFIAQFGALFETNEEIASVEIGPLAESVALGLTLLQGSTYGPFIADKTNVELWMEISNAMRLNAAFTGSGAALPIEITVNTNSSPPRRFQRTFVVRVVQL